jgi:acetyl esterase/lipase
VQPQGPFIDPKADSLSYYMMSKIAMHANVAWLRWCWQTYLGMEKPTTDAYISNNMDETPNNLIQAAFLTRGSNAAEWEKCKWSKAPFNRLVRPIEGIPSLKVTEKSPVFLIVVNKADSLYSEGVELAKTLKKTGFSVSLFEHTGIHTIGTHVDLKGNAERNDAWADILFAK